MALDLHFRFKPQVIQRAAADIFTLYKGGKIKPFVEATYALEDFQDALARFKETKSPGKLVLTTGRG